MTRYSALLASLTAATLLAACGGSDTPAASADADPAIRTAIETRQSNLKDLGAAMKTISDNVRSGAPDMAAITEASGRVSAHAAAFGTWFPEGSGPSAGVKTEALDVIWSDASGFQAALARFQGEAANLAGAVATGDPAAVGGALPALGGSCKNCHDNYRIQKD